MKINEEIERLQTEREQLKKYILVKLNGDEDWHAISDAANDLRDLDAKLLILNMVKSKRLMND